MLGNFIRILKLALLAILAAGMGIVFGRWIATYNHRKVNYSRVEQCLQAYIQFKKSGDQKKLQQDLQRLGISNSEFEQTIDRFIYYRTTKSALNQAQKLLEAFKSGCEIKPEHVVETSRQASWSFELDAAVLSIMSEHPELVSQAFGS